MKSEDIDKFVGKPVVLVDFDGEEHRGRLLKITEYYIEEDKFHCMHSIRNGYYLQRFGLKFGGGIDYRKSHIKKLRIWNTDLKFDEDLYK